MRVLTAEWCSYDINHWPLTPLYYSPTAMQ